ncbi:MAG: YihA family ribosome biogenesis GTP-binding protein [Eubacterium sp.]|nr:YihA family ribosome biogenesis GTP-binding protein [Eubacterium sp.]
MKIKTSELACVCGVTSKFPDYDKPEIAFAGRSNVGKSSLINSLLNRKNLARTSSSPGKTVTINFYAINEEFYLVDLPGYGYAKASLEERARWGKMIERYLSKRENLVCIVLLVDIRHAPSKDDVMMYDYIINSGFKPVIVATKYDKIKRSQKDKQLKLIRDTLKAPKDQIIIPHSSLDKTGREELLGLIDQFLSQSSLTSI